MAKGSKSSRSGASGTLRTLAKRPRPLSSIPRFRRMSSGYLVDTESGEVFGMPGSRPVPAEALEDGFFVPFVRPRPTPVFLPPPARKPPAVPRRIRLTDLRAANPWVCFRRKLRRAVIFAFGHSGRNGGRKYHRNLYSQYGC